MRRRLRTVVVIALFAASCADSGEVAVIERQVSIDGLDRPSTSVCDDIEAFALTPHDDHDLEDVVDELARIAAVLGASDALPHLDDMKVALDENKQTARALDAAVEIIDTATFDECEIPAFTAMYVSTSFAACFGRAPIAAGTMVDENGECEDAPVPDFLPCFDPDAGFVPVDCRTGTPVMVHDGEWVHVES